MKKDRPKFYIYQKNFNNGKFEAYDVLEPLFLNILNKRNEIIKKKFIIYDEKQNYKPVQISSKEQLKEFIISNFQYHYWSKCEWEFIAIDWPYRDTIDESRPVKIDGYMQLKPNIPVIVDLIWDYLEPKIQKLLNK